MKTNLSDYSRTQLDTVLFLFKNNYEYVWNSTESRVYEGKLFIHTLSLLRVKNGVLADQLPQAYMKYEMIQEKLDLLDFLQTYISLEEDDIQIIAYLYRISNQIKKFLDEVK